MKAITVKQPWAFAISHLGKCVENRTWSRAWRGQLAVHAGKTWDEDGEYSPRLQDAWRQLLPEGGTERWLRRDSLHINFGAVIAVADLIDVCTVQADDVDCSCDCGPWAAFDQCHWKLANVRPLNTPVPAKGALGLWTLPGEVEAAVLAQVGQVVR